MNPEQINQSITAIQKLLLESSISITVSTANEVARTLEAMRPEMTEEAKKVTK